MTHLVKWPSIESFHNVRKAITAYPHMLNDNHKVVYRPKVKQHGSNGGIQITDNGSVVAQSRTTVLGEGHDNAGFNAWVQEHKNAFASHVPINPNQTVTIFGEWSGPGIHKGCAIHKIENKIFAVFAAIIHEDETTHWVYEPKDLDLLVGKASTFMGNTLHVLPWHTDEVEVNWNFTGEMLQPTVDAINVEVDAVEQCDPWVKSVFGVEGIGEGLVYYPVSKEHQSRDDFSNLSFKAKGEKHKVVKTKKAVQVNPSVVASVTEFVDLVVTDARLEQGVQEVCNGEYDMKKIGHLLGFIGKDVSKECQAELEASGLTWKQVSKAVVDRARVLYIEKVEKL